MTLENERWHSVLVAAVSPQINVGGERRTSHALIIKDNCILRENSACGDLVSVCTMINRWQPWLRYIGDDLDKN